MAQVDYNLRPAKHIERLMIAHALRRLGPFGAVESYRYVGFGAAYYRDFQLFHRDLGITDMISIEQDTSNKARYEFNIPFSCIKNVFGYSTEVLPTLPWDFRTIVWLDYTDKLERDILADTAFVAANCTTGSVLIVTVNAQADRLSDNPLEQLKARVGEENVPSDVTDANLTGWGLASVSRRILANKVDSTLSARNGARSPGSRLRLRQLFNFEYADDAKMLTFGGLIHEEGQEAIAATCNFESLPFIRGGTDALRIDVPKLTYKEIHYLQSQLPGDGTPVERFGVPAEELDKFRAVYRYFPVFAPTDT